jgi:hypothetical protein
MAADLTAKLAAAMHDQQGSGRCGFAGPLSECPFAESWMRQAEATVTAARAAGLIVTDEDGLARAIQRFEVERMGFALTDPQAARDAANVVAILRGGA